jgi:hypothetical protein
VRLSLRHDAAAMEILQPTVPGLYDGMRKRISHFCVGFSGNIPGPSEYAAHMCLLYSFDDFDTSARIAYAGIAQIMGEVPLFRIAVPSYYHLVCYDDELCRLDYLPYVFLRIAAHYILEFTYSGVHYGIATGHAMRVQAGMRCTPLEELCG